MIRDGLAFSSVPGLLTASSGIPWRQPVSIAVRPVRRGPQTPGTFNCTIQSMARGRLASGLASDATPRVRPTNAMRDLFDSVAPLDQPREIMAEGAWLLRGAAVPLDADILAALQVITAQSPFRRMVTPGGFVMSVALPTS